MFQVPLSRLPVRSTNAGPIFSTSALTAVWLLFIACQHLKAGPVQSLFDGKVIIEGEPPFVFVVLIGDEIGDVPGQDDERLSGTEWTSCAAHSWFHDQGPSLCAAAYTRAWDPRKT